jgi:Family of unknown function (DUF5681)
MGDVPSLEQSPGGPPRENKEDDPAGQPDVNAQPKAKQPHRWKPGESGNPRGMKRGSWHKASLLAESLLDGETDRLTRRCIYEALKGDMQAMKLCLESAYIFRLTRAHNARARKAKNGGCS